MCQFIMLECVMTYLITVYKISLNKPTGINILEYIAVLHPDFEQKYTHHWVLTIPYARAVCSTQIRAETSSHALFTKITKKFPPNVMIHNIIPDAVLLLVSSVHQGQCLHEKCKMYLSLSKQLFVIDSWNWIIKANSFQFYDSNSQRQSKVLIKFISF